MIQLFRNSNPITVVLLLFVLIILRLYYFAHLPQELAYNFDEFFNTILVHPNKVKILTPFENLIFSTSIVFIQAIILNIIVSYHNFFPKSSWLPALSYILIFSVLEQYLTLSVPLVFNFFLLYIIHKLLLVYKQNSSISTVFDIGIMLGLSNIFYPQSFWLIIWVWLSLLVLRPFYWREWLSVIFGFINVYILLAAYYFYHHQLHLFEKLMPDFVFYSPLFEFKPEFYAFIPIIIISILGLSKLSTIYFKSFITVRKSFLIILFLFAVGHLFFFLNPVINLNLFLIFSIPLSILLSIYFLQAKNKWIYESLFIAVILTTIFIQYRF